MSRYLNILDKIDLFGVQISLLTNKNNPTFQSKIGGVISFFLSIISFSYLIFVLVMWINNEIPPNISSKQQTKGYGEFQWSEPLIQITLQDFTTDIDPFRKENNIITPLLFKLDNFRVQEEPIILYSEEYDYSSLFVNNGSLILNNAYQQDENHKTMKEYLLVLSICKNSSLKNGSYCADQEIINEYLSKHHGFLILTIRLNQFNYINQKLENFVKQYYQSFDPRKSSYSQVMLKQQETIIDDGILFKNEKYYNFLNNYELINQEVSSEFMPDTVAFISNGNYHLNISSSYLFRIDNISIKEEITMPKLGQVLAQIGSIVQLIFLLKYVAIYYNNKLLENQLFHDIISMYYPEFKNIKINIFNKFEFKEDFNQFQLPIQNLQLIYVTLLKRAKEKCRLNNILYEISRIQFILEQQFGNRILQNSHQLGKKFSKNISEIVSEKIPESNRLVIWPADQIQQEQEQDLIFKEPIELLIKQE
ncbi:unnamed protein product [Paramecium sonneborni]|uniref:Transmembrane protein n=1 Tax=Paramecium sonneborni TaxID=65129 RepID=A0A8S1Q5G2_9CILI|nr:unnamed protein product [Paramecium sonneborni]